MQIEVSKQTHLNEAGQPPFSSHHSSIMGRNPGMRGTLESSLKNRGCWRSCVTQIAHVIPSPAVPHVTEPKRQFSKIWYSWIVSKFRSAVPVTSSRYSPSRDLCRRSSTGAQALVKARTRSGAQVNFPHSALLAGWCRCRSTSLKQGTTGRYHRVSSESNGFSTFSLNLTRNVHDICVLVCAKRCCEWKLCVFFGKLSDLGSTEWPGRITNAKPEHDLRRHDRSLAPLEFLPRLG